MKSMYDQGRDYIKQVAKEVIDSYLSRPDIAKDDFEKEAIKKYRDLYIRGEETVVGSDFAKAYARKEELPDHFRNAVEDEKFRVSTHGSDHDRALLAVVDYPELKDDAPTAKRKVKV